MKLQEAEPRNSKMLLNEVYFWTASIKDWKKLFIQDKYKDIILNSLKNLHQRDLVKIYGFVIMPNHIHLIWEMLQLNGREMPHASFSKFTAHKIIEDLKQNHLAVLPYFKVDEPEREYRIWQRDPLAIILDYKSKLEQKLNYIHLNPLQAHWNLAKEPEEYYWSSVRFYETGIDDFGFLTDYYERFG